MKIIKKQSKQTFKSTKTGKEKHFYNYFLQFDNGKRVQIKCAFKDDLQLLDFAAEYER